MTTAQYLRALKRVGLTPASNATAASLGLSRRQCQRIAAGESPVPETVAKLLNMFVIYGLSANPCFPQPQ